MKIVVAMDSFKGSLTAVRACEVVVEAIRAARPEVVAVAKPMADGGEGTAATLMAAADGQWVPVRAMGPLPEMEVEAGFVWLPRTRTAVVEMAVASGLPLLRPDQQNPLKTTTYGTGRLVQAAIEHGAEQVLLAIGGSATVDGGVGAAMALGWRFLKRDGQEIRLGGGELSEIDQIFPPTEGGPRGEGVPPLRREAILASPSGSPTYLSPSESQSAVAVKVLCDVDNPLCGEHGAAAVYGPQKGATPEMVKILDANLLHLANLVKAQLGQSIKDLPGAGAAGGLAAGAVAFLDGRLVSGVDEVIAQNGLREELADADWVITGEGKFDSQSLRGKVVSGVSRAAREAGARVAVLAGQVHLPPEAYRRAGIEVALPCMTASMTVEYAIAHTEPRLAEAARKFADECLH
jgi:glycerate 2-kinase